MATINSVGLGLTGSTGTVSFVGSTSPTLVTPRIATINDTSGSAVLTTTHTSTSNHFNITNGGSPQLSVLGSDASINFQMATKGSGVFQLQTPSASSNQIYLVVSNSTGYFLNFNGNGGVNTISFPNNANTNTASLCSDFTNSGSITTAPPSSDVTSLTLGAGYQNPNGYDIQVVVYLSVTAATSADILLGVGSASSPTQQTIVSGLTVAAVTIIPVTIYLPSGYYAFLSTSGTITATISGQMQMPV